MLNNTISGSDQPSVSRGLNFIYKLLSSVCCWGLFLSCTVSAQTAQQIEQFQRLPAAEQQRLLQTLSPAQRQQALDRLPAVLAPSVVDDSNTQAAIEEDANDRRRREFLRRQQGSSALSAEEEQLLQELLLKRRGQSRSAELASEREGLEVNGNRFRSGDEQRQLGASEDFLSAEELFEGLDDLPPSFQELIEDSGLTTETTRLDVVPFGYDIFAGAPSTFAPANNIPVPADYVLGPGDNLVVQFYGKENYTRSYEVNRDGTIDFEGLAPVPLAGLSFDEAKDLLNSIVKNQIIGQRASITLGTLRSIRVFILGEANLPGSYTVSSLSTMTNALLVSGGIAPTGSLRRIQLKRGGELVTELDLYDLLLRGDTRSDVRLLPGDVLFVPPVGRQVTVIGEVLRPAIYEVRQEDDVAAALSIAGGLKPTAYPRASRIERVNDDGKRVILDVNVASLRGKKTALRNGDLLQVFSVLDRVEDAVTLKGHVLRPGAFEWRKGMRVTDLIPSVAALKVNPDLTYALLKREIAEDNSYSILPINLQFVLSNRDSDLNWRLQPRDEVIVFSIAERTAENQQLVEQLKLQATFEHPAKTVVIEGQVRFPGEYPLFEEMTLVDLIQAAYDLLPEADLDYVLRANLDNTGRLTLEQVDLTESVRPAVRLLPGDQVFIFAKDAAREELLTPLLEQLQSYGSKQNPTPVVKVDGDVRFPGSYPLTDDMLLSDLIKAAGGLAESADGLTAEVTRQKIDETNNAYIAHADIDLTTQAANGLGFQLGPDDLVQIKRLPNFITEEIVELTGEVRYPGAYKIAKGETLSNLLLRAGGLTEFANPQAAIFLREELRLKEQELLARFTQQLQRDAAAAELEGAQQGDEAQAINEQLLDQLATVQASGRLVIDLPSLLSQPGSNSDIELKNGDQLVIPRATQEVSVVGEVNFPTSHLYKSGLAVQDYINNSGGFTARSDKQRMFVIRANGEVVAQTKPKLFQRILAFNNNYQVAPGDTVVVPYDIDALGPLARVTTVAQILFQLSTTVAALNSAGVF